MKRTNKKGRVKKNKAFVTIFSSKLLFFVSFFLVIIGLFITQTLLHHISNTKSMADTSSPSVYYGVISDPYLKPDLTSVSSFETDANKPVSLIVFFSQWGVASTSAFNQPLMNAIRSHGSIPEITWESWAGTPSGIIQPQYTLKNIINGNFDSYITQFAQAAQAWGNPFYIRLDQEMNGNWYPWSEGINGNTSGQFAQMWQHVRNIFTQQGVTNVTWIWSPAAGGNISNLSEYYPGDTYVDWVAMDGFNKGGTSWKTFSQIFNPIYQQLLTIAPSKSLMIGAMASAETGGSKANWITDAFTTQIPNNFPQIKGFTWFNVNNGKTYQIESSPTAQSAIATALQSPLYATDTFSSLATSPIMPLPTPTPTATPTINPSITITPAPVAFDTFQRSNQSLWGTATDGHIWGGDANKLSNFSISNNTGIITGSTTVNLNAILGPSETNESVLLEASTSSIGSSNSIGTTLRWSNGNSFYKALINGTKLVIQKNVNGTVTQLASVAFSAIANTQYYIRFSVNGSTLSANAWQVGSMEPITWMVTASDTSLSSGKGGIRVLEQSGTTATIYSFTAQ